MARVAAPKSADYDDRADRAKREKRLAELAKRPTFTPAERDETLRLLLEDYQQRTGGGTVRP